jgi:subtilisin family serine protease
MKQHPDLLFILAAGNNGADLNDRAYYPASYAAENSIVVAATDSTSRLWKRSNWGVGIVDVAVEAVDLSGFDFDGHKKPLTGTSFAAPRVAALAARVLAENPTWSATQVKNRINALAEESGIKAEGIPVLTEKMLRQVIP